MFKRFRFRGVVDRGFHTRCYKANDTSTQILRTRSSSRRGETFNNVRNIDLIAYTLNR